MEARGEQSKLGRISSQNEVRFLLFTLGLFAIWFSYLFGGISAKYRPYDIAPDNFIDKVKALLSISPLIIGFALAAYLSFKNAIRTKSTVFRRIGRMLMNLICFIVGVSITLSLLS